MEQLGLILPESKPKPKPRGDLTVQQAIADKETLIFLYGMNVHVCEMRVHSSKYPTEGVWCKRKQVEKQLREAGYYHHCWYVESQLGKTNQKERAKVFRKV